MIHPKCLFSNLLNKMKKPSVKDLFAVWGVVLFVSAGIWIVAQSNANDEAPIMIDTNKYTATQHIQEVHLNDTSSSKKIWLKNQDGLVLGVGEVGADERVGKLKNDAGGASAVIAGSGNGNWWSESSLIVGGENNQLANGKIGSVVMGGKANQVDSSETVVLASKDSATHGTGAVVVAVDRGEVFGENSLSFAGDAIVRRNDSMVIGSAVMMNGEWSFVFNGREQQGIDVNTDNSFIVGANNGLIIGTNKNNGSGIGLTVNGAVKVGEARGNDNMQTGAIFRVACSSPAGASCLCANISGQVKSISSNPACDNVCAGKSKQCFLDAKCGTRAITYAAAETTRRANTDFCTVGSHVQGADPRFPNVGEVSWTCVSDFGGASANCSAKKKLLPKEDAKCGSYHGMNFMAASLTNWPAGWTFCEKGVPTPTVPAFPKTGKPVSWTCGGENLNTVPCSANGCNRCSKEGFPYCFPVDFGPSCGSTPTQPVNGVCVKNVTVPVDGTKLVDYAKANPSLFCDPGTLVLTPPEFSNDKLTWKCAWLNGWEPSQTCTVSCPSGYSLLNGACRKFTLISNDCRDTSIHQRTPWTGDFGKMVATIDYGCSIKNIRYQDTEECGRERTEIKINGNLMQTGSNISLPSHSGIDFPRRSSASDVQNKRIYKYDIYLWEQKIRDGSAVIAIMPCIPMYSWWSMVGGLRTLQNCVKKCPFSNNP